MSDITSQKNWLEHAQALAVMRAEPSDANWFKRLTDYAQSQGVPVRSMQRALTAFYDYEAIRQSLVATGHDEGLPSLEKLARQSRGQEVPPRSALAELQQLAGKIPPSELRELIDQWIQGTYSTRRIRDLNQRIVRGTQLSGSAHTSIVQSVSRRGPHAWMRSQGSIYHGDPVDELVHAIFKDPKILQQSAPPLHALRNVLLPRYNVTLSCVLVFEGPPHDIVQHGQLAQDLGKPIPISKYAELLPGYIVVLQDSGDSNDLTLAGNHGQYGANELWSLDVRTAQATSEAGREQSVKSFALGFCGFGQIQIAPGEVPVVQRLPVLPRPAPKPRLELYLLAAVGRQLLMHDRT